MIVHIPNLRVGYFTFNDPTLLLSLDKNALQQLSNLFQTGASFILESDCGERRITLKVVRSAPPSTQTEDNGNFTFAIDEATASDFVEKLRYMHISDVPCHNYLDPEINETPVEIRVALNEYGPDWIGWTFSY